MQRTVPALGAATFLAAVLSGSPVAAQTITRTEDLSFGTFAAGSGGTVAVSPQGLRTASGDVALISRSQGSPASFDVAGTANVAYQITLPANGTVALTNSNGDSMSVSSFASSPAANGQLGAAGTQTVRVGAVLGVGSNQAAGAYSGNFAVTVVFE